ncbi:MAG TPA: type II toxin-antitoxin system RelE/ParE family toxin [Candidatus Bathyarchaeia archaeon]|jgi:addiction module RelE/StbE family toxin|nr:type II toxin-antitoxin system RelE/ParE family toxin [Candidatus Bathyarchaeia archaeon]
MRLCWTASAVRDLERITDYLFDETPQHAPRLVRSLYKSATVLKTFPNRGRPGKKQGTRELVIPSLPYIVVYQVSEDTVYIARILHAAQQWPA